MAAFLSAHQHLCLEPGQPRKSTTRTYALSRLRAIEADATSITCSRLRARQCLEKCQGDSARMQDNIAKVIEEDEMFCDPAEEMSVCVVCGEDDGHGGISLFDCGHAVCFDCTTGMLLATYRDANFAMPCPYHSLKGCKGRVALLPEHKVEARALTHSNPDAPKEWEQYMRRLDDAKLKAAGMFACPSAFCLASPALCLERVFVVPTAAAHTWCDTDCDSCGLAICCDCTHLAGRPVPSHLPIACSRQVDIRNMASNLQADLAQEEQEARDREEARRREARRFHLELRHGGDFFAALSMKPREFPEIDAQIRQFLPPCGGISYSSIFRAAQTASEASTLPSASGDPAPCACAAEPFLPTKGWCANFVKKNGLDILPPSLGELSNLLRRHNRTKEAAVIDEIGAGTYRSPTSEPAVSDEELVMRTSKPCPTGCGWNITKNSG